MKIESHEREQSNMPKTIKSISKNFFMTALNTFCPAISPFITLLSGISQDRFNDQLEQRVAILENHMAVLEPLLQMTSNSGSNGNEIMDKDLEAEGYELFCRIITMSLRVGYTERINCFLQVAKQYASNPDFYDGLQIDVVSIINEMTKREFDVLKKLFSEDSMSFNDEKDIAAVNRLMSRGLVREVAPPPPVKDLNSDSYHIFSFGEIQLYSLTTFGRKIEFTINEALESNFHNK